ncbi:hypothetical protein ACFQ2B_18125 [Streptomyces stramineus]
MLVDDAHPHPRRSRSRLQARVCSTVSASRPTLGWMATASRRQRRAAAAIRRRTSAGSSMVGVLSGDGGAPALPT